MVALTPKAFTVLQQPIPRPSGPEGRITGILVLEDLDHDYRGAA